MSFMQMRSYLHLKIKLEPKQRETIEIVRKKKVMGPTYTATSQMFQSLYEVSTKSFIWMQSWFKTNKQTKGNYSVIKHHSVMGCTDNSSYRVLPVCKISTTSSKAPTTTTQTRSQYLNFCFENTRAIPAFGSTSTIKRG